MLKKDDLKTIIYEGATLDANLKKADLKGGYMVSVMGYERTFKPSQIDEIYEAILQHRETIKNHTFRYVGLWFKDGLVYVDISQHYKNKKDGLKAGIKWRQYAVYDIANNCDIDLLIPTYILYKVNKVKNDLTYVKEYYDIDELTSEFKTNKNTIRQYIYNDIDVDEFNNLLNDRYIIVKDSMYYKDFIEMVEAEKLYEIEA